MPSSEDTCDDLDDLRDEAEACWEQAVAAKMTAARTYDPADVVITFEGHYVTTASSEPFSVEAERALVEDDRLGCERPDGGTINKHRASYGQRPLDPAKPYGQAEPWTPSDVRAHAVELGWENEG